MSFSVEIQKCNRNKRTKDLIVPLVNCLTNKKITVYTIYVVRSMLYVLHVFYTVRFIVDCYAH